MRERGDSDSDSDILFHHKDTILVALSILPTERERERERRERKRERRRERKRERKRERLRERD